jgi:hypothetical protein
MTFATEFNTTLPMCSLHDNMIVSLASTSLTSDSGYILELLTYAILVSPVIWWIGAFSKLLFILCLSYEYIVGVIKAYCLSWIPRGRCDLTGNYHWETSEYLVLEGVYSRSVFNIEYSSEECLETAKAKYPVLNKLRFSKVKGKDRPPMFHQHKSWSELFKQIWNVALFVEMYQNTVLGTNPEAVSVITVIENILDKSPRQRTITEEKFINDAIRFKMIPDDEYFSGQNLFSTHTNYYDGYNMNTGYQYDYGYN